MSPELYCVGYARNFRAFPVSFYETKLNCRCRQTLLIPTICWSLCNKALMTAAMLRDTTKYTHCTTNFLLIQGKILGLAPSLATEYFHYKRIYTRTHSLDCRTYDKTLCINPSVWSDKHCSSQRKRHLLWSDEHCS